MQASNYSKTHNSNCVPLQTYEDANSLVFANAYVSSYLNHEKPLTHHYRILNETLRMFPPVRFSACSKMTMPVDFSGIII